MTYRLNPEWCATVTFSEASGGELRPRDLALTLRLVCHFASYVPPSHDLERFEEHMRAAVGCNVLDKAYSRRLSMSVLRRELGYRTIVDVAAALDRVSTAQVNGSRLFETVRVDGADVAFHLYGGKRAALQAHPMFARSTGAPTKRGDLAPYARRAYTLVDPLLSRGFTCAASTPAYLRVRTWLTTSCRDGLPPASRYGFDDSGELRVRATPGEMAGLLGLQLSRGSQSYLRDGIERVLADLRKVDVAARYAPARDRFGQMNAVLDVSIASARPSTFEDERDQGASRHPDLAHTRGVVRAAQVIDTIAPEPAVDVAPPVPVPPDAPAAPHEVEDDLDVVPDAAEPWENDPSATDGPTGDDGLPSYMEPLPDPVAVESAPVVPVPETVVAAPEPASVEASPEVDPDNDPNNDYLEPGEIAPGVMAPGLPVTVTRIGEPPSERDLGIAAVGRRSGRIKLTPGHRGCPPEETPHRHHQYPGVWIDQRCPEGHAPHYPVRAWYRDSPDDLYDTGFENDDDESGEFYVTVTPQPRLVHSFAEVMAYVDECLAFRKRDKDLVAHDTQFDPDVG